MNTFRSLLEFDALWRTVVRSGVLADVCMAGLLLLAGCFILKLFVVLLYERKPPVIQTIFPIFLQLSVLAAIISPLVYPSLCDVAASMFRAFTGLSSGWLSDAKKQFDSVILMIAQSEQNTVSFFNIRAGTTTVMASAFSLFLNLTAIVMFVSLILGPAYLFMCLISGPLVIAMSFAFGSEFLVKWFMMIIASTLIQVFVGIAFLVISDSGSLAAVNTLVGGTAATALEMALVMLILCVVLIVAVPLIHGYLFEAPYFYVFPAIIAVITAVKSGGTSLATIYLFYKQTRKKMKGTA